MVVMTYVLNDVAVITNEQERAAVLEIDLHADQAIRVSWKMVQCDALTEVERPLIECLPVPAQTSVSEETIRFIPFQAHKSSFK